MKNDDEDRLDGVEDGERGIALSPGANADPQEDISKCINAEVLKLYDVYSYRHAASILKHSFSEQLDEIEKALLAFRITTHEIAMPGGNESTIPKKISKLLRPAGWVETRIHGDLQVRVEEYSEIFSEVGPVKKSKRGEQLAKTLENYIDGHKIDYVKNRVAFDLEWNSKDQTFDRDLYALRAFHECGIVSVGVLVTRSEKMNPIFEKITQLDKNGQELPNGKSVRNKYGASTTWMGKLLYRLNAGRHGGCPVLVFGITPEVVEWI